MERIPQSKPQSTSAIPAKPMFQPRPFGESIQPTTAQPASEEQAEIDRPPIRNPDYTAIFAKPPARSAPWKPAPPIQRQADGNQAGDSQAELNTTASEAFQAQQSPESPDSPARSPFWHLRRRVDPQAGVQQATERQASPLASTNLLDVLIRNAQASAAPVQAKLTIGQPNDPYEQEADATAAKVMAMPDLQRQTASHPEEEEDPVQAKQLDESIAPIQREALPEEEDVQTKPIASFIQREAEPEEEVQTKPLAASITPLVQREALPEEEEPVQAKALAQPLGQRIANLQREALPEEEEAVQPKSLQQADLQRKEGPEEEEPVQAKVISSIQREALPEVEEPIQTKAIATLPRLTANKEIQRKSSTPSPAAHLESQLAAQKSGGSPLGDDVRSFMESRFNTDFSHVRVHTDSSAVQMNKDLSAQAFTHGSDVYFGAGKSPGQNELTAHELTHVVQQTGAKTLRRSSPIALKSQKDRLQTKIGAAVADSTIQRKSAPKSPQADPGFQAVVKRTGAVAKQQKAHPPAKNKATEAQAAAVPPANEKESKAQDRQVQEMNQQQPGQFNTAAFKAALMEKINAATPQNLDQADKFKDSNKLGAVKGDLSSQVSNEKKQAAGPVEEKTKEPPKTGGIPEKAVTPLPPSPPGAPPADIGAGQAAPKPKDAAEISIQAGSQSLDQQMQDAKVTEDQLEKSNEPEFKTALGAKKEAQTDAAKAPGEYRQQEQATLAQAQAQAQTVAQAPLQGMQGQKAQVLAQVTGQQGTTKGQDEQKRSEIAGRIEGIYNNTKQKVETLLSSLDGEVNQEFDRGASAAKSQFDSYVDQEMKRFKDKRYSGLEGKALWVRDLFLPLPDEVNQFYKVGRQKYIDSMTVTIDRVANLVVTKLNAAKAEIANGKQEIQKYVASLDPSLRQLGQDAAQNIQGKFDQLEQNVDNKQGELIDSLAQKYNENLQALDADIEKRKAENQGLVGKAKEAIGGVIQTILELKNMLMGMLAKAAGAVEKIIKDPIGFLGNLVAGIKQGFMGFVGNITEHLKKGLIGWLTGALAGAGIEMPKSFDLKGIFALVTGLLGLTYQGLRNRVANKVGEKKVSALEKGFDMFILWKNEGAAGLWKFIQDKLTNLKEMVMGGIQSFVIDSIINAGVTWVLSLLNPASAFVRACKLIIDVIMFFVERGSQIAELVNAVLDSVNSIADGAIGVAAKLVEGALGKALPVVIGFLASLIGLGGISGKIRSLIEKARGLIDKAIDWVMSKALAFVKKLGGKLGFGRNQQSRTDDPNHKQKVSAGLSQLHQHEAQLSDGGKITQQEAQKVANKVKAEHSIFKSVKVVDGGSTWNYSYIASPEEVEKGQQVKAEQGDEPTTISVTGTVSENVSQAITDPSRMLPAPPPRTRTLQQVKNIKNRQERANAGEQYVRETYGAEPGHGYYPLPTSHVGLGESRIVDAVVSNVGVPTEAGARKTQNIEVKTYKSWRTPKGSSTPQRQEVGITSEIRRQVDKDTYLKARDPNYEPVWEFLDAPPSKELLELLLARNILVRIHGR